MHRLIHPLLAGLCLGSLICTAAEPAYTVAVIPKGTTHEFWKAINAGAAKAQQELNGHGCKLEIIWKGPLREDDREQQLQVVENFTTRHVSAIVLSPLDSQAFVRPVHHAIQSKFTVVIMFFFFMLQQSLSSVVFAYKTLFDLGGIPHGP